MAAKSGKRNIENVYDDLYTCDSDDYDEQPYQQYNPKSNEIHNFDLNKISAKRKRTLESEDEVLVYICDSDDEGIYNLESDHEDIYNFEYDDDYHFDLENYDEGQNISDSYLNDTQKNKSNKIQNYDKTCKAGKRALESDDDDGKKFKSNKIQKLDNSNSAKSSKSTNDEQEIIFEGTELLKLKETDILSYACSVAHVLWSDPDSLWYYRIVDPFQRTPKRYNARLPFRGAENFQKILLLQQAVRIKFNIGALEWPKTWQMVKDKVNQIGQNRSTYKGNKPKIVYQWVDRK